MTLTARRIQAVLGDRHRVIESLGRTDSLARSTVDLRLLGCCEARIGELLGHRVRVEATPHSELERAAVAFTEHWVIDVASMGDELVSDLLSQLGDDGLIDFVHALLVVEQRIRLDLAWDQLGLVEVPA